LALAEALDDETSDETPVLDSNSFTQLEVDRVKSADASLEVFGTSEDWPSE
jgi:hypothetical protein